MHSMKQKNLGKETRFISNTLRVCLKKPVGKVIEGNKTEVIKKFKNVLSTTPHRKLICVGDEVSINFDGFDKQIKIFDGRTARNIAKTTLPFSLEVKNPPASITAESWNVLEKAINSNTNESVFVHGEEDLLVIPATILANTNDLIVYGIPNKGISYFFADKTAKKNCLEIYSKMKKGLFEKVIVGGTFDRLHNGHKFFLEKSSFYGKKLLIGITNDQLAKKKTLGESIEPFEIRKKHVFEYLTNLGITFEIVKLDDFKGPATQTGNAIIFTEETAQNAKKINEIRTKNNLFELTYIILPYTVDENGNKISSTTLRTKNIAKHKYTKKPF